MTVFEIMRVDRIECEEKPALRVSAAFLKQCI